MERIIYIIIMVISLLILLFFAIKVIGPKIMANIDIARNLLP